MSPTWAKIPSTTRLNPVRRKARTIPPKAESHEIRTDTVEHFLAPYPAAISSRTGVVPEVNALQCAAMSGGVRRAHQRSQRARARNGNGKTGVIVMPSDALNDRDAESGRRTVYVMRTTPTQPTRFRSIVAIARVTPESMTHSLTL